MGVGVRGVGGVSELRNVLEYYFRLSYFVRKDFCFIVVPRPHGEFEWRGSVPIVVTG